MSEANQSPHQIITPKTYIVILLALLVGTALTVWASFWELGLWNPVIALAIASTKMILVVLYFMHVRYSTKLTKLTLIAGVFMFLVLVSLILADYTSRAWGRW
jgi:cytochrome c oxidase subunit 4